MEDCIFCKIVKKEIPCEKIYEDEQCLAFLDINPVNIGHTLIIPKEHFENIYDLPEEIAAHLIKIAKKITLALKKTGTKGTNIITNNGKASGQEVLHSHFHLIPRYEGDNLAPWPKKKYKEGELKTTAEKITRAL